MAWSRVHNVPIVSLALTESLGVNGKKICIVGTHGQKKIHYTMLASHKTYGPESSTDLPKNLLHEYRQVIFNISVGDPFTHPRVDRLLTDLNADELVIFGIGFNDAIKYTALGLIKRGKKVSIIADATDLDLTSQEYNMNFRKLTAKGVSLMETASIINMTRQPIS